MLIIVQLYTCTYVVWRMRLLKVRLTLITDMPSIECSFGKQARVDRLQIPLVLPTCTSNVLRSEQTATVATLHSVRWRKPT